MGLVLHAFVIYTSRHDHHSRKGPPGSFRTGTEFSGTITSLRSDLRQSPVIETADFLYQNVATCYTQDDNALCPNQNRYDDDSWLHYSNKSESQQDAFDTDIDMFADWSSAENILEPGFDNGQHVVDNLRQNPLAAIQAPVEPGFIFPFLMNVIPDPDPNYEWIRIPRELMGESSLCSTSQSNQPVTSLTTQNLFTSIDTPALSISTSTSQPSPADGANTDDRLELPPQAPSSLHFCPSCPASFALSRTLESHIRACHSGSICPHCGIEVKMQLDRHIKEKHGEHRHRFACVCGKAFPRKSNFERHRRTHICEPGRRKQVKKRRTRLGAADLHE